MAAQESAEQWNLENTPTWAVAAVCTVFVSISLVFVLAFEKLEHCLKNNQRKPLVQALHKLKEELLLLGFISLMLAVFQNYISSICVKTSVLVEWHPCHIKNQQASGGGPTNLTEGERRLLTINSAPMIDWRDEALFQGRILNQSATKACRAGYSPFVSNETLGQLHTFIFILAGVHVVYSLCAMLLASIKVNRWRVWEEEGHQDTHDTEREVARSLSLHRQTTFIKCHTSKSWTRNQFFGWMICFFRQFGKSVARSDYLSLRLGFIRTHNMGHTFNFHNYIIRSLEDEYQEVVGISASLWLFVILFLLINAARTDLFFWLSLIPGVLVLLVGAKLQHVIATLALESAGLAQNGAFVEAIVRPRDQLFWFKKPQLILYLIHYIFFQNAFDMATFISFTWQFGLHSCLLRNKAYVYTRIAIGVIVQIMCSYSTLPLYALVTQMGSHYKQAIFQEHVKEKLRHWKQGAEMRLRKKKMSRDFLDGSNETHTTQRTDSNSADELDVESRHESGKDDLSKVSPEWEHMGQSEASPQHPVSSTLEIVCPDSENSGKPLLLSVIPAPTYSRTNSVPKVPTQQVLRNFYKQFSIDPRAGRSVHFQLDSI